MPNRKFKRFEMVTDDITTKLIIDVKDDHYLTDCGKIMFENEHKWHKIKDQKKK